MNLALKFIVWLVIAQATATVAAGLSADGYPEGNKLFATTRGWVGGDGIYSVKLSGEKILWLFGDTLTGSISPGHRDIKGFINNSVALQQGLDPGNTRVKFYYPQSEAGSPRAFFVLPPDCPGWLWPLDGIRHERSLWLCFLQIQKTGGDSVFAFKPSGSWLAEVSNPDASPPEWKLTYRKLPWAAFTPGRSVFYGSSMVQVNGFIYIFGVDEAGVSGEKYAVLSRTPSGRLADFSAWEFFNRGRWVKDFNQAGRIFPGIATEYSVTYAQDLNRYVCVYSEAAFTGNIVARCSEHPWGPWSEPLQVYHCPESDGNRGIFCYAARAHPEFGLNPGELIISYASNTLNPDDLRRFPEIYFPRFIRWQLPCLPFS